jgi:hypothetical protein
MEVKNQPIDNKPALAALALIAWAGVLLQLWLSINLALANGKTAVGGIVVFLGYFTVLTNLFVALCATLPLAAGFSRVGRWFAKTMVLGSATASIVLVGVAYHFLLRNIWQPQGLQWFADMVLHYAVPVCTLLFWIIFAPREKLGATAPLFWCLYPIGYFVYVFARGELLGSYPYYFIDATSIGYRQAMLNSFGMLVAFVVVGAAVLAAARLRIHYARLHTAFYLGDFYGRKSNVPPGNIDWHLEHDR